MKGAGEILRRRRETNQWKMMRLDRTCRTHQQLRRRGFSLSRAPPHQKSLKMLQKLIQSGTLKASKAAYSERASAGKLTPGSFGANFHMQRGG